MNHTIHTPERQLALLQAVLPRDVTFAEVQAHRELAALRLTWAARFWARVATDVRGLTPLGDGAAGPSVGG